MKFPRRVIAISRAEAGKKTELLLSMEPDIRRFAKFQTLPLLLLIFLLYKIQF
jgi:hypothetical protein